MSTATINTQNISTRQESAAFNTALLTVAGWRFALVVIAGELATHYGITGWQAGEAGADSSKEVGCENMA